MTATYIPVDPKYGEEFTVEQYCTDEKILSFNKFEREENNSISLYEKNSRIYTSAYPYLMSANVQRAYEQYATVPFIEYETIWQKMRSAIINKILTETVNGEKCYAMSYSRR